MRFAGVGALGCFTPEHLKKPGVAGAHVVRAHGGLLESFDCLIDHSLHANAFFFCHGSGGTCFVEEDGAVDDKEIVGGGHVAECFRVDEIVECGEQGFSCIDSLVDKARVGGGGVD